MSEIPEGATHQQVSTGKFTRLLGNGWWAYWDKQWLLFGEQPTDPMVEIPPAPWVGAGHPIPGTVVEVWMGGEATEIWEEAFVIGRDHALTVVRVLTGEFKGQYCSRPVFHQADGNYFRPKVDK